MGIDPSSGNDDHIQHRTLNLDKDMANEIVDTVLEVVKILSLKHLKIPFFL